MDDGRERNELKELRVVLIKEFSVRDERIVGVYSCGIISDCHHTAVAKSLHWVDYDCLSNHFHYLHIL